MTPDAVVGLVELLGKLLAPLGGTALLLALIYVVWRTGSGHLIRHRLWRLVYGKDTISDEVVRQFIDARTSLMAFRFSAGFTARTLNQAQRLAVWLKENDEEIATIRAVGEFFDHDQLQMRPELPKQSRLLWRFAALGMIWLATLTAGSAWFSDRGYFKMKKTGLWFSATESDVQGVGVVRHQERPQLTLELCRQNPPANGGFSADDSAVLCRFLLDPEAKSYVAKAVKEQQILLGFLVVAFVVLFARELMKIRQLAHAWQLARRLEVKNAQLQLPF